ncbi:hypothetical protein B7R70_09365 [Yersinia pseudotuberculosis]|nr:hypothetical protein B7R70_09365 [Yersinia pseudotuberculosis]
MGRWWRYKWITFHPSLTLFMHVYCCIHLLLYTSIPSFPLLSFHILLNHTLSLSEYIYSVHAFCTPMDINK